VIRLGLRLSFYGGREAFARFAVTAAGVALGVGLLLASFAAMNGVNSQDARGAWLNTQPASQSATSAASHTSPVGWLASRDEFEGQTINRIDIAVIGPRSPVIPGLSRLPRAGEYYASPALARLLHATPATQLGSRFPGHEVGTIGAAGVPNPNSLIVVVGYSKRLLSMIPGAREVTSFATSGFGSKQFLIVLAIGTLALLFPVLIFLAAATRIAAARREERFAAMRLVGATPRQVSQIAAVETTASAIAGIGLGFILYFALQPALARVSITGVPFAPGDLSLNVTDVLLVALGVPIASALASRLALRRVLISPLGVSRRVTPPPPRPTRLVPLFADIVWLVLFAVFGKSSSNVVVYIYFVGFLALMVGLIWAGPWLMYVGARAMARRTNRADVLVAGRRLSDSPRVAFRSISGLVLALFMASLATGIVSTIVADNGAPAGGQVAIGTLVASFGNPSATSAEGQNSIPFLPSRLARELGSIKGVRGVTVIYWDSRMVAGWVTGLVSCAELGRTPALGRCESGASVATIEPSGYEGNGLTQPTTLADQTWQSSRISAGRLARLPVEGVVVGTNGSSAVVEQVRTAIEVALPSQANTQAPTTLGELLPSTAQSLTEAQNVTDVIIVASLIIAGCSLAVGVTAGMSDRKRPFSLLRLTGVPVVMLRRVVALEAALPLLVAAVVSAGIGLFGAELFLHPQLSVSLRWPGALYCVVVLVGVVGSIGLIASTLPLMDRITGPEVARNE
jgi:hypothetical protein